MSGCLRGPILFNPCLPVRLPESLANNELVRQAFDGLRPDQIWDGHVHLLGTGDSGSGAWINPQLSSLRHPLLQWQRGVAGTRGGTAPLVAGVRPVEPRGRREGGGWAPGRAAGDVGRGGSLRRGTALTPAEVGWTPGRGPRRRAG